MTADKTVNPCPYAAARLLRRFFGVGFYDRHPAFVPLLGIGRRSSRKPFSHHLRAFVNFDSVSSLRVCEELHMGLRLQVCKVIELTLSVTQCSCFRSTIFVEGQ